MKTIIAVLSLVLSLNLHAQYRSPLDIPLVLSANFGELRPNHFHAGVDFKTQNVINKPIYAIADGYVSRVSVSPSGYGLAIYVSLNSGHTSVCGHVERFAPRIAAYIKEKQYEKEQFSLDVSLDPHLFPVKRGEIIAYSGNTGSSAGPHVHFELRNTATQLLVDPLLQYKHLIKDTQAPLVKGIAIYPIASKGSVNNSKETLRIPITTTKEGNYSSLKNPITAWGTIGISVSAIDRMDGTTNIYGVKIVRLYCNETEVFSSNLTSVNPAQTRMLNSFVDFAYWYKTHTFYMQSFVEPGNKLPIYKAINNGYITIDKETTYNLLYELEDLHGNKTTFPFTIIGAKQDFAKPKIVSQLMPWDTENDYTTDYFTLSIPKGSLYNTVGFVLTKDSSKQYASPIYTVHDVHTPLDGYCSMTIQLTKDSLAHKAQYGIVKIEGGKESWIGGTYSKGSVTAKIRQLGDRYAISTDNKPPVITPVLPAKWVANAEIKIRISDNKSGISTYKGIIDGKYVLFTKDVKSATYSYTFDAQRLTKGQIHHLLFTAKDACGNTAQYEYKFKW